MDLEFIEKLTELTENKDLLAVGRDVSELRVKFEDYILEEERKAHSQFMARTPETVDTPKPKYSNILAQIY